MVDIYEEAGRLLEQILKSNGHTIKALLFNPSEEQQEHDSTDPATQRKGVPCLAGSRDKGCRSPAVVALVLETLKCTSIVLSRSFLHQGFKISH